MSQNVNTYFIIFKTIHHVKINLSKWDWLYSSCIAIYRIQGIGKIRNMQAQLEPMRSIVGQLKKEKDSANKKVDGLQKEMQTIIQKMKVW